MKILEDKNVLAGIVHIKVYRIDEDRVCQREAFHTHIFIKDFESMRVRCMELFCDRCCAVGQIAECFYDQQVRGIGTSAVTVDETEGLGFLILADRVYTPSPALFQFYDQLIGILKDRVVHSACFNASGVYPEATERAVMDCRNRFYCGLFDVMDSTDVRDLKGHGLQGSINL
jgi:hypothetical protein